MIFALALLFAMVGLVVLVVLVVQAERPRARPHRFMGRKYGDCYESIPAMTGDVRKVFDWIERDPALLALAPPGHPHRWWWARCRAYDYASTAAPPQRWLGPRLDEDVWRELERASRKAEWNRRRGRANPDAVPAPARTIDVSTLPVPPGGTVADDAERTGAA